MMLVSVIIPCYNVQDFIEECIESVLNQTYTEKEIICVDNNSTDNTWEILTRIKGKNPQITIVKELIKGASAARNKGLSLANGDYIQFLDADDILKIDKIQQQILIAKKNFPDIVVGSYQRQNLNGDVVKTKTYTSKIKDVWLNLMKSDLGITSSNLFKVDSFKSGIQWDVNLKSSQEYTLMFEILKKKNLLSFDPQINTIIRVRDSGSISLTEVDKKWERYVQLRVKIIKYLQKNHPEFLDHEKTQVLFDSIRILYQYNTKKALEIFNRYIPTNFIPRISSATSKKYVIIYQVFGFNLAEKLRLLMFKNNLK